MTETPMPNLMYEVEVVFAGGPMTSSKDANLRALMDELRRINRDRRALEALGRHTLTLVSKHLKAGIYAEKAVLLAKGAADD